MTLKIKNFKKIMLFFVAAILFGLHFYGVNAVKKQVDEGFYTIESELEKNKVLDVSGASKEKKANIQLWGKNNTEAQIFYIKKIKNEFYEIRAVCSDMALDVAGGKKANGTNVWQYPPNSTDAQMWKFEHLYDDVFTIKSKLGNFYLDVEGGRTKNGTNVRIWEPTGTDAQQFKLKKFDENNLKTRGLINVGSSCYLNATLQQLYTMEHFRNKVLNFNTNVLDKSNTDHKKLIAVKKIFEYLQHKTPLTDNELRNLTRDLGHDGRHQQDSNEYIIEIIGACQRTFESQKTSHTTLFRPYYETNFTIPYLSESVPRSIESFLNFDGFENSGYTGNIQEFLKKTKIFLKIKEDKLFTVNITTRKSQENPFLHIDETMTFNNVRQNLFIVNKFKDVEDANFRQLNTFNCELVSATVHRGTRNSGHYYIYKKNGSSWFEFNDSSVERRTWGKIRKDISQHATSLVYKLLD